MNYSKYYFEGIFGNICRTIRVLFSLLALGIGASSVDAPGKRFKKRKKN